MFSLIIIVITLIISGCTPTGYEQSYILISDPSNFSDAEALNTGQQPEIFGSDDFIRDSKILASKKYTLLGMSLFCGAYDRIDNALKQAKKIGATIVLVRPRFAREFTKDSSLFSINNRTVYHVSTFTDYGSGCDKDYRYKNNFAGHDTKYPPYPRVGDQYAQIALYFAKATPKFSYGIVVDDLMPEQKVHPGLVAGAVVVVVVEGSPAFSSNVIAGDIIVAVNGKTVENAEQAWALMKESDMSERSTLRVIRRGVQREIIIKF